jgi:hypothetical protein
MGGDSGALGWSILPLPRVAIDIRRFPGWVFAPLGSVHDSATCQRSFHCLVRVHVITLERVHEGLGQAIALRAVSWDQTELVTAEHRISGRGPGLALRLMLMM